MKFRECQVETVHRIEVRIRQEGDLFTARADVQPLGDAEEHWFIDSAPPKHILIKAQEEANSRGIPLCVRLEAGIAWNPAWDEAFDIANATRHTAAPHA